MTVIKALEFAKRKHDGQKDKGGHDYYSEHILQVYNLVLGRTEYEIPLMVAALHDTLEDTDTTYEELVETFGERVAKSVRVLTKPKDVELEYDEYIQRVKKDPYARVVKIADLMHNRDISRIGSPTQKDYERTQQYTKSLHELLKPIVYFDMDGVLVDFKGAFEEAFRRDPKLKATYQDNPDEIPRIFRDAPPVKGAVEAVKRLHDQDAYDLYIASTSPWDNPAALTDKLHWIQHHFGDIFYKRVFFTHHKNLLVGDYLVDDRTQRGADEFSGTLLPFGINPDTGHVNKYPDWEALESQLNQVTM